MDGYESNAFFMNYADTVDYLMSALPMYQRVGEAAYKADLSNSHALDLYDGAPHENFLTIHVAGTNGKGSVSHMLAAILQKAGYKTGLLTSPHMLDFRERIQVDGAKISEEYVVEYVESHRDLFEEIEPSFFEMAVAMGFSYFSDEGVDIAVVEVGMGGRLDSTNIISPLVSVVTSIGYDHTAFLGNSLTMIAQEKAGIIKPGRPLVVGGVPQEIRRVFIDVAKEKGCPFVFAEEEWTLKGQERQENQQTFHYDSGRSRKQLDIETDLLGDVQAHNVATVLATVEVLRREGIRVSWEIVREALKTAQASTHLLGRWQVVAQAPRVVLDMGHNEQGLSQVVSQVGATPYKSIHWVLGFANDKDIAEMLALLPKEATYYFVKANVPRGLDASDLQRQAQAKGLVGKAYTSVKEGIAEAKGNATPEDLIMVGGSAFVVAEALETLGLE